MEKDLVPRLGIFSFHDDDGMVDDYVVYLLNNLRCELSDLIIVVDGKIKKEYKGKLLQFTSKIIQEDCSGICENAWAVGLNEYVRCIDKCMFDEIVLFSDALFGPIDKVDTLFNVMQSSKADFWGLEAVDKNFQLVGAVNAFFVIKKWMFASDVFKFYWERRKKNFLVDQGDIGGGNLIRSLCSVGFVYEASIGNERIKDFHAGANGVGMLYEPFQFLAAKKSPFLPVEAFHVRLKDSLRYSRADELFKCMNYLEYRSSYPIDLIWQYILRKYPMSDIFDSIGLQHVIPSEKITECLPQEYIDNTLIILHIYYDDQMDFLLRYAKNIPEGISVLITTNSIEKKEKILNKLLGEKCFNKLRVILTKNHGRDVAALMVAAREEIIKYDYICFLHDKKSVNIAISSALDWQELMWENLLASPEYVINILALFKNSPRLGLILPPRPFCGETIGSIGNYWAGNLEWTRKLRDILGICVPFDSKTGGILAIGNVFWCRREALQRLWDIPWKYEDFPPEPLPDDGTISHALERIYPQVAQQDGFYTACAMTSRSAILEGRNAKYLLQQTIASLRFDIKNFPGCYLGKYNFKKMVRSM